MYCEITVKKVLGINENAHEIWSLIELFSNLKNINDKSKINIGKACFILIFDILVIIFIIVDLL